MTMSKTGNLDKQLDAFNLPTRAKALRQAAQQGKFPAPGGNLNLHYHSFFSYNAEGWSPSHVALEARRAGLYAAGLCDFDVLDGLEEFLEAGRILGLRATVNLETRAYLAAFADKEMSSPGEPGVTYIMGAGFSRVPKAGTPQAQTLQLFRDQARARNLKLLGRIEARLPKLALDYAKDVLPLTPAGVATERHIIRAYANKGRTLFPDEAARAAFWAEILGKDAAAVTKLFADVPAFEEVVRAKLVKKGGVGYEQPTTTTFPAVEDFVAWVRSCDAVPMATWLDGTSNGESDAERLLSVYQEKGCVALNIIPDRNWNLKDAAQAATKQAKLAEIVAAADRRALPLNIGTEMNKAGLPFVDDLAGPVLKRHAEPFLRGAKIMVGHQVLARYAGYSYAGARAAAEQKDLQARNTFFAAVGALPPVDETLDRKLTDAGAEKALSACRDSATKGQWTI
jgi:hypothetical protein